MTVTARSVVAGDIEFGLLEAGEGPLALCLHGFPDTAGTWRHLLPTLAAEGFHAVAPFLRGYAPTAVPDDGAYQVGALAADANALHRALGGTAEAVLIGHDWGAFAAYAAAAAAPERWRRLVTLAVPPPGAWGRRSFEQHKRFFYSYFFQLPGAERAVAADNHAFLDGLWAEWSPGYTATEDLVAVKAALGAPENLAAAIGYYRAMMNPALHHPRYAAEQAATERVPDVPTLYLHGADDGCVLPVDTAAVDALLPPGSQAAVVPGVGHFLHLEQPDAIGRRIVEWLG